MNDIAAAADRGFDFLGFAAQIDGAGARQIDIQRVLRRDFGLSAALDIDIDGLGSEITQLQIAGTSHIHLQIVGLAIGLNVTGARNR